MRITSQHVVVQSLLFVVVIATAGEVTGQPKSPVPEGKSLEAGHKAARERYGPRFKQATTSAEKLALAKQMLDAASTAPDGSADQYALLRIAGDVAANAGEPGTALMAMGRLAARFDVPAAKLKAEILSTAARHASRSSQQKAVAEAAATVVDELVTADEYEAALALCEAARGCARSARQNPLLKELTSRGEAIKQQAVAFQQYRAVLGVLKTSPKDGAANLAAGRYLCITKGDWDRGLAMLALGSDADLSTLAMKELQRPSSAEEQVALADAWWSLANSKSGQEKDVLRRRAGSWYKQAKLRIAGALLRVKVTARLDELSRLGVDIPKLSPSLTAAMVPSLAAGPLDEQTAKEHQAAWADYLRVPVETTNSIGMKFMLIPPGEFDMGSTEAEVAKLREQAKVKRLLDWSIRCLPAESPKHRVRITKAFWLSRQEVTRGQFRRFVDERGYRTEAERDGKGGNGLVNGQRRPDPRFVWHADLGFEQTDDYPVVNVTWNDATAFCAWLSEKEGETVHLPSEAQWEYACRAGTATSWYSGDDEAALKQHAWFNADGKWKTHPVGQKSPNAWGLYDMHGNVWEWCQDRWGVRYYATSPMDDPRGASGGANRVYRGGCGYDQAAVCRSAFRVGAAPEIRTMLLGFRVARVPAGK